MRRSRFITVFVGSAAVGAGAFAVAQTLTATAAPAPAQPSLTCSVSGTQAVCSPIGFSRNTLLAWTGSQAGIFQGPSGVQLSRLGGGFLAGGRGFSVRLPSTAGAYVVVAVQSYTTPACVETSIIVGVADDEPNSTFVARRPSRSGDPTCS